LFKTNEQNPQNQSEVSHGQGWSQSLHWLLQNHPTPPSIVEKCVLCFSFKLSLCRWCACRPCPHDWMSASGKEHISIVWWTYFESYGGADFSFPGSGYVAPSSLAALGGPLLTVQQRLRHVYCSEVLHVPWVFIGEFCLALIKANCNISLLQGLVFKIRLLRIEIELFSVLW